MYCYADKSGGIWYICKGFFRLIISNVCERERFMTTIRIFYFSGTGNAKKIALWFSEIAEKKGIDVQLLNIAKINKGEIKTISSGELIVIISPIHGFHYPPIMLKFIKHFPEGNNNVVLMNTRGGLKIGNIVTPGLSGASFICSSFVLRKKGYKIKGQIPFDMPSNWISIHPALTGKAAKFIDEKNYKKVEKHAGIILSEQSDFLARRDLIQDILFFPVSLAWYLGGRFFFAKSYYATNACNNCGICEKECPVHAIKESDSLPFWTYRCESCMKCMNICPKQAIETAHGLWALLIVVSSLLSGLFCKIVNTSNHTALVKFSVFSAIFFLLLFIFYRIHHLLLKNKFIRKLVALTSLTHYKFWGRFDNNYIFSTANKNKST